MNFYDSVSADMSQTAAPVVFAVFSLLNARRYALEVLHDMEAFNVLDYAIWALIWDLSGDTLAGALACVHLDNFRSNARLLPAA